MPKNVDKLLAERLIDRELISREQLDSVIKEAEKSSHPFAAVIIEQGWIEEGVMLDLLAQELKLPFTNLRDVAIDKSITETVPLKFATYYSKA